MSIKMIYNVVLVSGYSTVIHLYIYPLFFRFFSHMVITEYWVESPVLHSRSLLVIYFVYSSLYLLIPNSQFILPLLFHTEA